jgi:hypothetical protein
MRAFLERAALPLVLVASLIALAGCGGGDSDSAVGTDTVTVTDEGFTDTRTADPTLTDPSDPVTGDTVPSNATRPVEVGESAAWSGNEFVVSDVETSDEEPVGDMVGEKEEAEGVWLAFKITPADDDSRIWGFDFHVYAQVRGGDGVVYLDPQSNAQEQSLADEEDFLMWIDIPEEAVSGAILEIGDGIHYTVLDPDPDVSTPDVADPADPAYATRIDLGQ